MRHALLALPLLLAGCVTFEVKEDHFFIPGPAANRTPVAHPVELQGLAGAHITTPEARVEVVYFGGNASRIDDFGAELARTLNAMGANLLMFDYRGYGRSAGTPTIAALKEDAVAILRYAREHAGGRPVVVHGFSLGSFMAAHAAATVPVDGLVLESTAPDVEQWARNSVPAYAKPFVRLKIAPALQQESVEQTLRRYSGPLMLITGSRDAITPRRFSTALHAVSASANKRVVIVPGAEHGTAMDSPAAVKEYAAFLDSVTALGGRR
jgi:uncharacterized protein